jgi:hypothetical protein
MLGFDVHVIPCHMDYYECFCTTISLQHLSVFHLHGEEYGFGC